MKQFVLNKKSCSGRGVRIALLTQPQIMQIRDESAKEVTADTTMVAWEDRQTELGVAAMVVEVTEKDGFIGANDLLSDAVKWKKLNADDFIAKRSELFTPKDLSVLDEVYKRLHKASDKEIEDILGEALDVTSP